MGERYASLCMYRSAKLGHTLNLTVAAPVYL